MNFDYIIVPIVGAVIGYTTNWLAIKMLFRPYNAKYFFKFKIPFTPGIIPKERKRIASSLGATVSSNVLNEETLITELKGERVLKGLDEYLDNLSNHQLVIDDLLVYLNFDKEVIYHKITTTIVKSLKETINNEELKQRLINSLMKDTNLESRLPANTLESIEEVLEHKQTSINQFVLNGFANEKIQTKLYEIINGFMDSKFKMLKAFIKVETIYKGINEAFNDYIKSNPDAIVILIQDYLKQLGDKSLHEIINEKQIDSLATQIINFINSNLDKQIVYDSINNTIENLATKSLRFNPTTFEIFKASVKKMYLNFIDTQATSLLNKLNINIIVENKINSFSTWEMEKLIVGLMRKELNAITLLGALLGFIMGLITLIF